MAVPHGDNHDIWLNPNNPELLDSKVMMGGAKYFA